MVFDYAGCDGPFRFNPSLCVILDSLFLPGLLFKAFEMAVYHGPTLGKHERLEIDAFRQTTVQLVEKYRRRAEPHLRDVLARKTSFQDIIEGVDWWRYHGGVRDPDGHPKESPEYSP